MRKWRNLGPYSVQGICRQLGGERDNLAARGWSDKPWEIYRLEKCGEIL